MDFHSITKKYLSLNLVLKFCNAICDSMVRIYKHSKVSGSNIYVRDREVHVLLKTNSLDLRIHFNFLRSPVTNPLQNAPPSEARADSSTNTRDSS